METRFRNARCGIPSSGNPYFLALPSTNRSMENAIKAEIKRLCRRAATRQLAAGRQEQKYAEKFEKRTGITPGSATPSPSSPLHRHFNPAYCARNANFIARTIWHKVRSGTYRPTPAVNFKIPKPTGGHREIMAFTIPDAALANVTMWRARTRNLKRLSPFSYAYHPDKNVFDAVLALSGFVNEERLFAVQIDFEKYFDSIPTRYLKRCVDDPEIVSLTPDERFILKEFLYHQYASPTDYVAGNFSRRVKGTPQGSSASLLLANLANHELDRSLERRSGRFVRFADDVVAVCGTYDEAQSIEKTFTVHCASSGLVINEEKSKGIAIIANVSAEIRSFPGFDYLGYRFTKDGLTIPNRVKRRIIAKLSRLIHLYLIHYPQKFGFSLARCNTSPAYDWDLLGLISEIRGYLYGGLSEKEINAFLATGKRLRKMRGLMGFYALLERKEILQELDGWLVNNVRCAMVKRNQLLKAKYSCATVTPTNRELILGSWLNTTTWSGSSLPELKLPSFVRGWRAARKYYFTFGLEDVEPPSYGYYS